MNGWIKLHRKLTDKAFYKKDSEKVHLWIHILLMANHEGREEMFAGKPIICNPGQFTTGRKQLSEATGIEVHKIDRVLSYFEKTEQQIEQQMSSTNRLITVLNWHDHQNSEQQIEQQVSSEWAASEQQVSSEWAHSKNIRTKELKNERTKEYKNILLSEIDISEFPMVNFEYFEIAKGFQELFRSNLIEAGSSTSIVDKAKGSWIDDVRLMIEVDKFTVKDLREVFRFLKVDAFWKQNILSTKKLREQMPKLKLKIHGKTSSTNQSNSKSNGITEDYKRNVVERLLRGGSDEAMPVN